MIISVASGKGGTGKTLVATSLALSPERDMQLLDCDVEEPNAHILLRPTIVQSQPVCIPVPKIDEVKCTYCGRCAEVCAYHAIAVFKRRVLVFPGLCHGCGACSYLCPEKAIVEQGKEIGIVEAGYSGDIAFVQGKLTVGEAMAPPVIRMVKHLIEPAKTVIIDVSPGTSCPVVESVKGSDFCLLVTEPTPFGLYDLSLMVQVVRKLGIRCGVVVNRTSGGNGGIKEYCLEQDIPILLEIPLDREIARLYSRGIPLVVGMPEWRSAFRELLQSIEQLVSARGQAQ